MPRLTEADRELLHGRFRDYLRDKRLPLTRQRREIAETVIGAKSHLSVSELEAALRAKGTELATATVYRTLEMLVESGVVRGHDFGEGFRRYEAVAEGAGHGHLVCGRCGTVSEFSHERLERMLPLIADEHSFLHQRHLITIHGLCAACRHHDLESL